MDLRTSRKSRRIGVVVNYASLLFFLVFYYIGFIGAWSAAIVSGMFVFLGAVCVSFVLVHITTGLWSLGHSAVERLDERQIQVTHGALRHSYAVFTVICLLVMMFNAVTGYRGHYMFDVVLPVSLLYFAHTLPSSVIAWKERSV